MNYIISDKIRRPRQGTESLGLELFQFTLVSGQTEAATRQVPHKSKLTVEKEDRLVRTARWL